MGYKQPTPQIAGPLFHYAANAAVMHCPGDRRYLLPLVLGFCWDSYSGVAFLNGEGGGLTKECQFLHPSERFLWVEGADGRGENVGSWVMANGGTATNEYSTPNSAIRRRPFMSLRARSALATLMPKATSGWTQQRSPTPIAPPSTRKMTATAHGTPPRGAASMTSLGSGADM